MNSADADAVLGLLHLQSPVTGPGRYNNSLNHLPPQLPSHSQRPPSRTQAQAKPISASASSTSSHSIPHPRRPSAASSSAHSAHVTHASIPTAGPGPSTLAHSSFRPPSPPHNAPPVSHASSSAQNHHHFNAPTNNNHFNASTNNNHSNPNPNPNVAPNNANNNTDAIRCVCGYTVDDGFSIACDVCSRWCHAACFGIAPGAVPDEWRCWVCDPRVPADRERARRIQRDRARQRQLEEGARIQAIANQANNPGQIQGGMVQSHSHSSGNGRRTSPGVERNPKRRTPAILDTSGNPATATTGTKRKRRPSIVTPSTSTAPLSASLSRTGGTGHNTPSLEAGPSSSHAHRPLTMLSTSLHAPPHPNPSTPLYGPGGAQTTQLNVPEDDYVDIDITSTYVPLASDHIPDSSTRALLTRPCSHAAGPAFIRGVSALCPPPPPPSSSSSHPNPNHTHSDKHEKSGDRDEEEGLPITLTRLPRLPSDPWTRPPSYALHTAAPIPAETLITPLTSTIQPASAYLADPLNGYTSLGMPRPHVHLVPPPLALALDARLAGNKARFIRSGCTPNAVLRPALCRRGKKGKDPGTDENMATDNEEEEESEEERLGFAVFATRDLKKDEEIVLGWEWDDGAAVHHLPAVLADPLAFPPSHVTHLKRQCAAILSALAQNFTRCACGENSRDCVLRRMEEFALGDEYSSFMSLPAPTPSTNKLVGPGVAEGYPFPATAGLQAPEMVSSYSSGSSGPEGAIPVSASGEKPKSKRRRLAEEKNSANMGVMGLGPLIGLKRGFRAKERGAWGAWNGGMEGAELVVDNEAGVNDVGGVAGVFRALVDQDENERDALREKGKEKEAIRKEVRGTGPPKRRPEIPEEKRMPPRYRRSLVKERVKEVTERETDKEMDVDEVPPVPVPPTVKVVQLAAPVVLTADVPAPVQMQPPVQVHVEPPTLREPSPAPVLPPAPAPSTTRPGSRGFMHLMNPIIDEPPPPPMSASLRGIMRPPSSTARRSRASSVARMSTASPAPPPAQYQNSPLTRAMDVDEPATMMSAPTPLPQRAESPQPILPPPPPPQPRTTGRMSFANLLNPRSPSPPPSQPLPPPAPPPMLAPAPVPAPSILLPMPIQSPLIKPTKIQSPPKLSPSIVPTPISRPVPVSALSPPAPVNVPVVSAPRPGSASIFNPLPLSPSGPVNVVSSASSNTVALAPTRASAPVPVPIVQASQPQHLSPPAAPHRSLLSPPPAQGGFTSRSSSRSRSRSVVAQPQPHVQQPQSIPVLGPVRPATTHVPIVEVRSPPVRSPPLPPPAVSQPLGNIHTNRNVTAPNAIMVRKFEEKDNFMTASVPVLVPVIGPNIRALLSPTPEPPETEVDADTDVHVDGDGDGDVDTENETIADTTAETIVMPLPSAAAMEWQTPESPRREIVLSNSLNGEGRTRTPLPDNFLDLDLGGEDDEKRMEVDEELVALVEPATAPKPAVEVTQAPVPVKEQEQREDELDEEILDLVEKPMVEKEKPRSRSADVTQAPAHDPSPVSPMSAVAPQESAKSADEPHDALVSASVVPVTVPLVIETQPSISSRRSRSPRISPAPSSSSQASPSDAGEPADTSATVPSPSDAKPRSPSPVPSLQPSLGASSPLSSPPPASDNGGEDVEDDDSESETSSDDDDRQSVASSQPDADEEDELPPIPAPRSYRSHRAPRILMSESPEPEPEIAPEPEVQEPEPSPLPVMESEDQAGAGVDAERVHKELVVPLERSTTPPRSRTPTPAPVLSVVVGRTPTPTPAPAPTIAVVIEAPTDIEPDPTQPLREPTPASSAPSIAATPVLEASPLPETSPAVEDARPSDSVPAKEPTPPPAPKVKLSLKDFAERRKKKQQEEEAARASSSVQMSPSPARETLSPSVGEEVSSPVVEPPTPVVDVVPTPVVEIAPAPVVEVNSSPNVQASPEAVTEELKVEETPDDVEMEDVSRVEEKEISVAPVEAIVVPAPQPIVNGINGHHVAHKPVTPPPMEVDMDSSSAPDSPEIPTSSFPMPVKTMPPPNGVSSAHPSPRIIRRFGHDETPQHSPTVPTIPDGAHQAKLELIENVLPPGPDVSFARQRRTSIPTGPRRASFPSAPPSRSESPAPATAVDMYGPRRAALATMPQPEDGEILSVSPLPAQTPPLGPKSHFARGPPSQPRAFQNQHSPNAPFALPPPPPPSTLTLEERISPFRVGGGMGRGGSPPTHPAAFNGPRPNGVWRAPPSGPRALRGAARGGAGGQGGGPGHVGLPRGPLADRVGDRGWNSRSGRGRRGGGGG